MKILHITPWFPNKDNTAEALWIKRHIDALEDHCTNVAWHIGVNEGKNFSKLSYQENYTKHRIMSFPTNKWLVLELINFCQLFFLGLFNRRLIKSVDVINFHIAYPSLTYWSILKKIFNKPTIITEHWSAYHFNFGVKKELPRIQKIFNHNIPLIAVSEALIDDIKAFAEYDFPCKVIPNIVESSVFFYDKEAKVEEYRFFMVSQWKSPKDPFSIIEQFSRYLKSNPKAKLIIGGYGPQEEEMLNLILEKELSENIEYVGKLSSEEIASEMNRATAFIHLSDYETFSVVCAEAICCGCPVIASNVGGIVEFINQDNGILIDKGFSLEPILAKVSSMSFNRAIISKKGGGKFSSKVVGKQYYNYLKQILL